MKRFLRYFLYREAYRHVRRAMRDSSSESTANAQPTEPGKANERQGHTQGFPADGSRIETPAQLKAVLQRMDAYDFEHFVGDLWERMGWETTVSTATADKGVDVTATKSTPYEQTLLIQAKRYGPNTTVGSPEVQQYASLRQQYHGVDTVLLVTTNAYTRQATELANTLNVKLINGDELVELVLEHDALDLVVTYLDFVEAAPEEETQRSAERADTAPETDAKAGESEESDTQSTQRGAPPSTRWHKGVIAATIGWVVVFFSVVILPETLWAMVLFVTWLALPVSIFLDAREIRAVTEWPRYTWAYVLVSLLWIVAIVPGIVYLWRRRSVSLTAEEPATTRVPETETEVKTNFGDRDSARVVGYGEDRYTCQVARSPNGEWLVAYGRSTDADDARVFVYDETGLQQTVSITEPTAASVADTGRTVAIDALDPDEHAGKLVAFEPDGTQLLTHVFNGDVADCTITADGTVAVVTTYPPADTASVFDLEAGDRRATHELRHEKARDVTLSANDSGWEVQFRTKTDAEPSYAIDLDGEVVWENTDEPDEQRDTTTTPVAECEDRQQLRATIESLHTAYDDADTEPERKDIAHSLADAHWALADMLEDHDPDAMRTHLERAKARYFELLPWYEGTSGAARVLRRQGVHYRERGEHERAAACFEQITQLEDEYGVQLRPGERGETT